MNFFTVIHLVAKDKDNKWKLLIGLDEYSKDNNIIRKWGSFGGKKEENETVNESLVREFYEESMGIFGSLSDYENLTKKNKISERNVNYGKWKGLEVICKINYDDSIVDKYNNIYNFLKKNIFVKNTANSKPLYTIKSNPVGLFEKVELKWISLDNFDISKLEFSDEILNNDIKMSHAYVFFIFYEVVPIMTIPINMILSYTDNNFLS